MIEDVFQEVRSDMLDLKEEEKKKKDSEDKSSSQKKKPGNPWHSKRTGKFTDPEKEDTCHSLFFSSNSGRTRATKGSKRQLAISDPQDSGRGPSPDGQGSFKCSTGKKKVREEGAKHVRYKPVNCRQVSIEKNDELKKDGDKEKPTRTINIQRVCDLEPMSDSDLVKRKKKNRNQRARRYLQQTRSEKESARGQR